MAAESLGDAYLTSANRFRRDPDGGLSTAGRGCSGTDGRAGGGKGGGGRAGRTGGGTGRAGGQSLASRRQPSQRARPIPPARITSSWFQRNTGAARGASAFIQARLVRTCQS